MNSRERLAALKIATLLEEFSPEELAEAATALSYTSTLPEPLSDLLHKKAGSTQKRGAKENSRESKAIQALKETEPRKYELLADFEAKVRRGEVLKNTRRLIQLVSDLGLDAKATTSRQVALGRLMKHLADLPVEHASELIAMFPEDPDPSDSYRRLATYIHKGYDPGPSASPPEQPEGAATRSAIETRAE